MPLFLAVEEMGAPTPPLVTKGKVLHQQDREKISMKGEAQLTVQLTEERGAIPTTVKRE